MSLRAATRDLHHRAEQHPVGAAMAAGTISPAAWADWLVAMLVVHLALDPLVPAPCRRREQLAADLRAVGAQPVRWSRAASEYASALRSSEGAFYVFTGAHLMGGALIEKRLAGRLPCSHLRWDDRKAAIAAWSWLREEQSAKVEADARLAFQAVLDIMDEIHAAA